MHKLDLYINYLSIAAVIAVMDLEYSVVGLKNVPL